MEVLASWSGFHERTSPDRDGEFVASDGLSVRCQKTQSAYGT